MGPASVLYERMVNRLPFAIKDFHDALNVKHWAKTAFHVYYYEVSQDNLVTLIPFFTTLVLTLKSW